MNSLTVENFRCFRGRQTAVLAPLTLLVGENGTGKTSFLALVRTLRDMALDRNQPDFKKPPYDLGSFDEIAHYRGGKGGRAREFTAGFCRLYKGRPANFEVTFRKEGVGAVPRRVRVDGGEVWCEFRFLSASTEIRLGTPNGRWERTVENGGLLGEVSWRSVSLWLYPAIRPDFAGWQSEEGAASPSDDDLVAVARLASRHFPPEPTLASAPVRSRPYRTYDPARPVADPYGIHVPMLLAELTLGDPASWEEFKAELEAFGREVGLFDEIRVRTLGRTGADPFQIQVRKRGGGNVKGPFRDLVDVGYGVSQILPAFTELLRGPRGAVHLLQQPEIHLHPSAQAALGSLFCRMAAKRRQLIVETHSEYLLDRVRMDLRDRVGKLKPEDVSILYFERVGLEARIHCLRLDAQGNVRDAPPSYASFFLEEVSRSIRPRRQAAEG